MGTQKKNYEKSIPVYPSQRRELREDLEWLVFKKDKSVNKK